MFDRRSTKHSFCPDEPLHYWIDYKMDTEKDWKRAQPVFSHSPIKNFKLLYDPSVKQMVLHVTDPKSTPGKYTVIFSPNEFIDWIRFPLIVCAVNEPQYLFDPPGYSLKFRPDNTMKKFNITQWPVLGGGQDFQCGTTQVILASDDRRLTGAWFWYSKKGGYVQVDPEHDTAPNVTEVGEQKIKLDY
jgi:hypothetical protein